VAETSDITMPQLAAELLALGTTVTPASISPWFRHQGYRFNKNAAGQQTRTRRRAPGVQAPGAAPAGVSLRGPSGLDQTGTSTRMTRLRGRCLKGQQPDAKAPFGHWLTQTFGADDQAACAACTEGGAIFYCNVCSGDNGDIVAQVSR